MRFITLFIAVLMISGCASKPSITQTVEFRHFVRDFFNIEEYQKKHVQFPLEVVYYSYNEDEFDAVLLSKHITEKDWKHYEGPDYYRCESNCFDLVIYDDFQRTHKESNERVLSFEGVSNGINSSLYFKRINGQWYLVKHEQFDN
ncbi:hypothetical protein Maes01_02788 [Microbulbifer aestuariivivens]|uniref:DUF4348 domain-containing protein n=1 Tax=Microbulbifer aestuariivivens TaxID=1908308 RepID=A0ABP9WVA4_9GAMM